MTRVVVVGGGVGGLTTALALGRSGHQVVLVERDPLPASADPEAAFLAPRRGAPQVHQTHGFLARIQVELRRRFPDVLEALHAAGGTTMPLTAELGEPQPGDEDLSVIIIRRTTFEWVLRRAVVADAAVEFQTGRSVVGLLTGTDRDGAPAVAGVRFADGSTMEADAVVAATGRRGAVPEWFLQLGVDLPENVHESGLMYLTRWYRLPEAFGALDPKLGGDLGFVKYLGVPGDAGTLSVTLAVRPDDHPLRNALADAEGFERACRLLPGPDQFFRHGPLEPVGGVRPMAGLLNRLRQFTDSDGAPLVLGFHAVGDAHTCTNPLYGRGCSLAVVQAGLLDDAFTEGGPDPAARAVAYERACAAQVEPWFHLSVEMDRSGADPAGMPSDDGAGRRAMMTLLTAAATDPVLGRGVARLWNLLATPAELMSDPAYTLRAAEVLANPEAYPVPDNPGPTRDELLAELADLEHTSR